MTTSIQTDALLATFSDLAYKDEATLILLQQEGKLPSGWTHIKTGIEGPFVAFAFQHMDGRVIITYRGTDGVSDLPADTNIMFGKWGTQFTQGLSFVQTVASLPGVNINNILVTGHSLGGAIAQVVSYAYGLSGATIDPAAGKALLATDGFEQTVTGLGLDRSKFGTGTMTNWAVSGSGVSGASGDHIGTMQYVPGLEFSGWALLKGFALTLLNPAVGIAGLIVGDQFANKHSAEQTAQAVNMLATAASGQGTFLDGVVNLIPKQEIVTDPYSGQQSIRYLPGEFLIKDAGGTVLGGFKFSGNTFENRKLDVLDAAGGILGTINAGDKTANPVSLLVGKNLTQNGTETNLYSLTTPNASVANWNTISDSTSSGPSSLGNTLVSNGDYLSLIHI